MTVQGQNTLREHESALAKWRLAGLTDYSFGIHRDCYCFPMGWMAVDVESGTVSGVDSIAGRRFLFEPAQLGTTPTVEELFETVRLHLERPDYSVEVDYDGALGYPTRIEIRNRAGLRDADQSIRAFELKPL